MKYPRSIIHIHEFDAIIQSSQTGKGGAWVAVPVDIKKEYGVGRLKVKAKFDGVEYTGSVVNMGVKNSDGSICYIIGVLKSIRKQINKNIGDTVHVTLEKL